MNERLPYEEQFSEGLNDLPLPDADKAWEKMEAMLDKEDGERRLPPPIFLRSCLGWGLLLLLGAVATWFFLTSDNEQASKVSEKLPAEKSIEKKEGSSTNAPADRAVSTNDRSLEPKEGTGTTLTAGKPVDQGSTHPQQNGSDPSYPSSYSSIQKQETKGNSTRKDGNSSASKTPTLTSQQKTASTQNIARVRKRQASGVRETGMAGVRTRETKEGTGRETTTGNKERTEGALVVDHSERLTTVVVPKDSNTAGRPVASVDKTNAGDTANGKQDLKKDTVAKDPLIVQVDSTGKKKSKKSFYLSGGIALQQVIPIAGQSAVPYNYLGRTSSIYDYIPSLYLRLHRDDRWYIQGEFRYGAPQTVKEFPFSRTTVYDSASNDIVTTSVRLKKTYYHQLPLSFNYYVRPKWSVGAGTVFNYFFGAVTEEEVRNRDLDNNTESVKTRIQNVRGFKDSFLYKTHVQFLLQTEYEWRRFVLGLRYTRDVQPYIRYTRPDGAIIDEKNQAFQIFLRFRILQTKR